MWSLSLGICNTFQQPKIPRIDNDDGPNIFLASTHDLLPSWETRNQPNALTRQWDIYLKEGYSDYASVNPQTSTWYSLPSNWHCPPSYCPIYPSPSWISHHGWLKGSIPTSGLQLWDDPVSAEHLTTQSAPSDPQSRSLLCHSDALHSEAGQSPTLCSSALAYYPLQVISVRQRLFTKVHMHYLCPDLPGLHQKTICKLCYHLFPHLNLCATGPLQTLKQLLIPEKPWNSISMDL